MYHRWPEPTREPFPSLRQPFVKAPEKTIAELVTEKTAKTGERVSIRRFTRYALSEGLQKKQEDFAAEVSAQVAAAQPKA